jgi:hypothetical protein
MANVIKGSAIIEDKHLSDAIQQAEKYLESVRAIDKELKLLASTLKSTLGGNGAKTAKEFQQINQAVKQSGDLRKQQESVNKALVKSQDALNNAYKKENEQVQRNRTIISERNKQVKQQIQLERTAEGSVVQLRIKLSQLTKEYDGLSRTQRENDKVGGSLQRQIQKIRLEVGALEKATGRSQRDVGNYGLALQGAANQAKNLAFALGAVGGVQLFSRVIRDAFNIVKDFDKAQANLAAISGLSAAQLAPLTQQAKDLGASTAFTAGQVSQLQLELAKLGFTADQIRASAEPILNLSAALGADLGEAAALTGSALKAFGLEADQAGRVTDVLVKAANSAAVDFAFFNTALSTVAPVANAVNVDIEKTSALLGTLANAGIDASTSATGLRNIFLQLAKTGESLPHALDRIKNSSDQAKTALSLFGARGASLGVVLANNQEATANLDKTLRQAGGTAKNVAEKQLDSLDGQLKILRSAWEGYILGADGATGASEKLKNIVKTLAENLPFILNTLINLIKVFVSYKVATFAANTATQIYNSLMVKSSEATKKATESVENLNKKAKLNPFGLWVAALVILVPLLIDAGKEVFNLVGKTDALAEVTAEVKDRMIEEKVELNLLAIELNKTTTASQERQDVLDKINAKYGTTLQNLSDEREFVVQLEQAYKDLIKQLEARITAEVKQEKLKDLIREQLSLSEQLKEVEQSFGTGSSILTGLILPGQDAASVYSQLTLKLENVRRKIKQLGGEIVAAENQVTGVTGIEIDDIDAEGGIGGKSGADKRKEAIDNLRRLHQLELKEIESHGIMVGDTREIIDQDILNRRRTQLLEELALTKKLYGDGSKEVIEAEILLQNEWLTSQKDLQKIRIKTNQLGNDAVLNDSKNFWDAFAKLAAASEKKRLEDERKAREEAFKALRETLKSQIELIKDISDAWQEALDRQIEVRKTEVGQHNDRISELKQLAAEGNLTAEESIKAEEAKVAKLEGEIRDLEKRKAALLTLNLALQTALNLAEQGDPNAINKGFAQVSDKIKEIPTFKEGTEDTGQGGSVDKDRGFKAILHPHERVIPEHLNSGLLERGLTNEDVSRMAIAYHDRASVANLGSFENIGILSALNGIKQGQKEVVKAIESIDIPEYQQNYDAVQRMMIDTIKYNHEVKRIFKYIG